jgi:hypothetical protein
MQEKQVVPATGARQKGFEESSDGENIGWEDAELRYGTRKGKETANDGFGTVSAESAQLDGHVESG